MSRTYSRCGICHALALALANHALNILRSSALSGILSVPSIVLTIFCDFNKGWPASGSSDAIHFLKSSCKFGSGIALKISAILCLCEQRERRSQS